jgi:hypothetical protein
LELLPKFLDIAMAFLFERYGYRGEMEKFIPHISSPRELLRLRECVLVLLGIDVNRGNVDFGVCESIEVVFLLECAAGSGRS